MNRSERYHNKKPSLLFCFQTPFGVWRQINSFEHEVRGASADLLRIREKYQVALRRRIGAAPADRLELTTVRVARSAPRSLASSMERISASRSLARFAGLLMVPTADPQIWAARSELFTRHWTLGFMVTTSVGTPSRPPLTGERMAERGWLLKRSYPVLKNR